MPISLIAEITPQNNGSFALLDDAYQRGGFHVVDTLTTRNSIPSDRLKYGMKVFVQSTDIAYELKSDLITWIVDRALTSSLQMAYNNGAQIVTTTGNPVAITGPDTVTQIFTIQTPTIHILEVDADGTVEIFNTLRNKDYTSSITYSINQNGTGIVIDSTDKTVYRAIQYFYTITNSDNSGFETGQLYIIQDGINASIYAMMGNATGIACNISFSCQIMGNQIELIGSTLDSALYSRIVHLFKVALQ